MADEPHNPLVAISELWMEVPPSEPWSSHSTAGRDWAAAAGAQDRSAALRFVELIGLTEGDSRSDDWRRLAYGTEPHQRLRQCFMWNGDEEINSITETPEYRDFWSLMKRDLPEQVSVTNGGGYCFVTGVLTELVTNATDGGD